MALLTPYAQSVTITACIYAIAALGLYFTIASGQFSIMQASLMGVGGYIAAVVSVKDNWSFWMTLAAGAAAGAAMGFIVSVALRKMSGMLIAVATLAIGVALSDIVANIGALGGAKGYELIPLRTGFWGVVGILAVALAAMLWLLRRTTFGLALVAAGRDPIVADSLGISPLIMRLIGFAVGGGLAGVAGALSVQFVGVITPDDLGYAAQAPLFVFVVLGGVTTPWGAVLGAIGVTWGLELLRFSTSDRFWIEGLVLAVVVLVRPQGILIRRSIRSRGWKLARPRIGRSSQTEEHGAAATAGQDVEETSVVRES